MFISEKFIFNGVHCDDMNIILVTMDSDIINKYGLDYKEDMSVTKSKETYSFYSNVDNECDDIVLQMCLVDEHCIPLVWDDEYLNDVLQWLIQDDFCEFISEDNEEVSYYFKATNISKTFTFDKVGYLEVTFKPFSNCAFRKINKKINVSGECDVIIDNLSNINQKYSPIIEIKNKKDRLNIIGFENLTTNDEELIVYDLDVDDIVTLDCCMGTIFNQHGDNLLSNCNRRWLKLNKGKNIVRVRGHAEITFMCQFPVRM